MTKITVSKSLAIPTRMRPGVTLPALRRMVDDLEKQVPESARIHIFPLPMKVEFEARWEEER